MLYRILKIIVSVGIRSYYKEVKVLNKKVLRTDGPLIFISNHPNTLMDAMMIGFITKKPVYFMAKGTLFNSPFKLWLLKNLNMIPINRRGDGAVRGVKNQNSFDACYRLLEQKKSLVVFPEGTSFLERQLRELKSGTARIALEVESRHLGQLGVKVIPLGLNYHKAEKFRSSVLVHIGEPIKIEPYINDYKSNPGKTAKLLTELFRVKLEEILIHTTTKDQERLIDSLEEVLSSKYLSRKRGVEHDIQFLRKIKENIDRFQYHDPKRINEIELLLQNILWQLRKLDIKSDFLDRRFRSVMFIRQMFSSIVFVIIGMPLFLYGLWHNMIQYKLTDFIVPKITKDIEYYAPLAVLLSMVLYPCFYTFFFYLVSHIFEMSSIVEIIYIISMPLSGFYAYWFNRYLKHISYKWRYILLMVSDSKAMEELKAKRKQLRSLIFED